MTIFAIQSSMSPWEMEIVMNRRALPDLSASLSGMAISTSSYSDGMPSTSQYLCASTQTSVSLTLGRIVKRLWSSRRDGLSKGCGIKGLSRQCSSVRERSNSPKDSFVPLNPEGMSAQGCNRCASWLRFAFQRRRKGLNSHAMPRLGRNRP